MAVLDKRLDATNEQRAEVLAFRVGRPAGRTLVPRHAIQRIEVEP